MKTGPHGGGRQFKQQKGGEEARGGGRDARANWVVNKELGGISEGERGRDHGHFSGRKSSTLILIGQSLVIG